jgi:uncharacterized linocin/CFP29 family protein
MAHDLLERSLAPILPEAWDAIDDEARRVLKLHLAGRKLVDFLGPFGWAHAAVSTGRMDPFDAEPVEGVHAGLRRVQALVEMRTPIKLPILELDARARGATDTDLDAVRIAAERTARAEDGAIFNGYAAAGIVGLLQASPHAPLDIASPSAWPRAVLDAKEALRRAGIDGPYALALGTEAYETLFATAEDGYPIVKRIERHIVDGPIVRASAIRGGALVSVRGGDYELTIGQDLSIGYAARDRTHVELFLTESFTFRVLEPKAAVHLRTA